MKVECIIMQKFKAQVSINGDILPVGEITENRQKAESEAMLWKEYYKGKSTKLIKIKIEVVEVSE